MTHIGIMIEGQEDLTWERFFRLADAVERLGFESLFRSDHLTSLVGFPKRETLALWASLTALAVRTRRIRFGPLVSPMTFRHPVEQAKLAAAVSVLSGGRLDMGIGAGWNEHEHHIFGVPYPRFKTRLEILDEGATVIKGLWSGEPQSFQGKHYQLNSAEAHPSPLGDPPPLIMGGKGDRTLALVAKHATEWNASYLPLGRLRDKLAALDEQCRAIGRDLATLRRSLMIPFVIGKDDAEIQKRIDARRAIFPHLPQTLAEWRAAGFPAGTPEQVIQDLYAFQETGITRFMLQHNDLDDTESLELLAQTVLPHFHKE